MELYYNPEQMSEKEIKQTFVGRQWLVDELLALIKRQPKGAGVQHVLVIGPRGMGKTTMLLMLRFGTLESDLARKWQPVRFHEESYSINDLADFWLMALSHLSYEVSDPSLLETVDRLKSEYKDAGDLSGAAYAALKDWSRKAKRRLVLLVDNLDMIFDQIGSSEEMASLRSVLMNDGTVMLVGTATSFFKEARNYDQALYNFFRPFSLDSLGSEQVDELLRQRAVVEEVENFEARLQENRTRIKVLHYFTGGNPRLILMLYRIIVSSNFLEVRRALEKLLDEVTPYYKAKIEVLPAQQRKILDCIARVSGRTGEGLTPTQIAQESRLSVNQTSAQLKRLSDLGYVRAADVRGRNAYYSLAEPLYAIWHQMRFGREGRRRMEWLTEFLKAWYSERELVQETERLAKLFTDLLGAGDSARAKGTIEARKHLSAAMDLLYQTEARDRLICDCLDSGDREQAGELLCDTDPVYLSASTLARLRESGLLTDAQLECLKSRMERFAQIVSAMTSFIRANEWKGVINVLHETKGLHVFLNEMLWIRAHAHMHLRNFEDSLADCDELMRRGKDDESLRIVRVKCLLSTGRTDEAAKAIEFLREDSNRKDYQALLPLITEPSFSFAIILFQNGPLEKAADCWKRHIDDEQMRPKFVRIAAHAAKPQNVEFLRTLRDQSHPYPEFLLLDAILTVIETGEKNAVSRLSSETRLIAEEILAEREKLLTELPPTAPPMEQPRRRRKAS